MCQFRADDLVFVFVFAFSFFLSLCKRTRTHAGRHARTVVQTANGPLYTRRRRANTVRIPHIIPLDAFGFFSKITGGAASENVIFGIG